MNSKSLLPFCFFALLIGIAYTNSLGNEFVYDDRALILQNAQIRELKNIPHFFTSHYWANVEDPNKDLLPLENSYHYRPLVLTSFALNFSANGDNPTGYHLVNMVLHLLVVWTLYQIGLRLTLSWEASVLMAAIFAVHSLHSETVTGLSGRAELLMSLGILGSLLLATSGYRWQSFIILPIGLLAKEQAVMFPVLLALWHWCKRPPFQPNHKPLAGPEWKGAFFYYGPFGLLVCGYLLARHLAIGNVGIPQPQFLENPLAHVEWWPRVITATKIAGKYLTLWLWPGELSADYSYNAIPISYTLFSFEVVWAVLLWSALAGLGIWGWRRDRRITFGIELTLIAFFPISNLLLPIGTIMGERLFYLPSAGLCILAGIGWDYIYERGNLRNSRKFQKEKRPKSESRNGRVQWYRIVSMTLAVLTITSLTVRTAERNMDWKTELTLFNSALSVVPNNAKAYLFLADAYSTHGQNTQALAAYKKALHIYPELSSTNVLFNNNYGSLLIREGRISEAIQKYEEALTLNPQLSTLQHNLALAYALGNQPQQAKSRFLEAIRLNPRVPKFHVSFSLFLANQGESVAALEQADWAIKMEPQYALAYYARGVALELEGRKQEAIHNYQKALSLDHTLQPAKQKLISETF